MLKKIHLQEKSMTKQLNQATINRKTNVYLYIFLKIARLTNKIAKSSAHSQKNKSPVTTSFTSF